MNKREWHRREFLQATVSMGAASSLLAAAQRNIYWGLGLVTWKGKSSWPEILQDVDAAGFDGVEPFTAKFLNDEAMDQLDQLLSSKVQEPAHVLDLLERPVQRCLQNTIGLVKEVSSNPWLSKAVQE